MREPKWHSGTFPIDFIGIRDTLRSSYLITILNTSHPFISIDL